MNAETECYYTTCYDNELKAISHYRQFPRMMPFIGKNYGELYPRILIIGESHYLPREAQIHLDADTWYASKEEDVEKEQLQWQSNHPQNTTSHWLGWISTRGILNKNKTQWVSKGHTIYRNMIRAMAEAGMNDTDTPFRHCAYMNAFQRPARTGDSIDARKIDRQKAKETIEAVIRVIRPEHIIFVSRKAARTIHPDLGPIPSYRNIAHPASVWWNRKRKDGTNGKERFTEIIRKIINRVSDN